MGESKKYETSEGTALLNRLRAELQPAEFFHERSEAGSSLVIAVAQAAHDAGFEAGMEGGAMTIALRRSGAVQLGVADNDGQVFLVRTEGPARPHPERIPLRIAYDPSLSMFVGEEDDPAVVPVPGRPFPKKSAVVVVVEAIAATIREQHAETRRRREAPARP